MEDWYETLSPSVTALWSTLVLHFHVKWLRASLDLLLEKVSPSVPLDAATSIVAEPCVMRIANANAATIPAHTTVPAHTVTAAPAIFETPAPPEPPSQTVDVRNVTTVESALAPTTATTTPREDEPQRPFPPTTNFQPRHCAPIIPKPDPIMPNPIQTVYQRNEAQKGCDDHQRRGDRHEGDNTKWNEEEDQWGGEKRGGGGMYRV